MSHKPADLNNHLFAALDRLSNPNLTGEQLENEVERSRAMIGVSKQILDLQKNVLEAEKLRIEYGTARVPKMLSD